MPIKEDIETKFKILEDKIKTLQKQLSRIERFIKLLNGGIVIENNIGQQYNY